MPKVTLDMHTFKALASDTRLDILRALDGKKLSLKDLGKVTRLNKATLHEHLAKLNEAGLVKKKEREGHKWVYYKLTWKGEGLLHPENTRIVVMFGVTFVSLFFAIMLIVNFAQPITIGMAEIEDDTIILYEADNEGIPLLTRSYGFTPVTEVNNEKGGGDVDSAYCPTDLYQTVNNLTVEFQKTAKIKNSIGVEYKVEEIKWESAEFGVPLTPDLNLLFEYGDYYNLSNINITYNESGETNHSYGNDSNGNESNVSEGDDYDRDIYRFAFSPEIPSEMIATVQDVTLLYSAIACLACFLVFLSLGTWRLKINKKPKL